MGGYVDPIFRRSFFKAGYFNNYPYFADDHDELKLWMHPEYGWFITEVLGDRENELFWNGWRHIYGWYEGTHGWTHYPFICPDGHPILWAKHEGTPSSDGWYCPEGYWSGKRLWSDALQMGWLWWDAATNRWIKSQSIHEYGTYHFIRDHPNPFGEYQPVPPATGVIEIFPD